MTSLDEVKRLLDGEVDPEGLEINSELYEMAESIYGREALEQMGIDAPARPSDSIVQPNGNAKHEVQMPVEPIPQPEIPPPKPKKRSWWIFIPSLLITITIIGNFVKGIGWILPFTWNKEYFGTIFQTVVISIRVVCVGDITILSLNYFFLVM